MTLIQDISVTAMSERLSYFSVRFASGASQLLAFMDDSDERRPEYDCSGRRTCSYENLSARLNRPYTRGEKVWLFFDGLFNFFIGLSIPMLLLILVIGVLGALIGVWSFNGFGNVFAVVMLIELMILMPPGFAAWAGVYPDYPDTRLKVPEEELAIDRKIVAAWQENDLGAALTAALAHA